MTINMTLIKTKTVGSGGASFIEFTSIPATYTDLKLVASTRDTDATVNNGLFTITLNGSVTFTSARNLSGNGSLPNAGTGDIFVGGGDTAGNTANTFSNVEVYFPNYLSTDQKSISAEAVSEQNGATAYMAITSQRFNLTSAITAIKIAGRTGWAEFTSFSLYGISSIASTPKATGGYVSQDTSYWYHMFPSSGIFTPTEAITTDILVVAGGGGADGDQGAGAGAGGLLTFTSQSLSATGYSVVVGAGGAGSTGSASNGGNSQFGALTTVIGGGAAGVGFGSNGSSGGSGGGGKSFNSTSGSNLGGSPTSGQGNAGGGARSSSSGGGGGAGAAGSNGTATYGRGGAGGVGATSALINAIGAATQTGKRIGSDTYYAGGGGGSQNNSGASVPGGDGGYGGGGNATANLAGENGLTNTGGGGAGGGWQSSTKSGGSGGSGIVVIRYAK